MKYALLSVYNKEGITTFAEELIKLDWKIISSGGTAKVLKEARIEVTDVAEITGRAAVLDHRVVTLAPEIHGGLMAADRHVKELEELGWPWISMVCVDLYPLQEEIKKSDSTRESVLEKTDIGGPTMLRSGAKGRRIVIADVADRMKVIQWLKDGEPEKEKFVEELAAKTEGIISDYCLTSARFISDGKIDGIIAKQVLECKYGENAHQNPSGLFEKLGNADPLSLTKLELLEGSAPSFVNLTDIDRLLQTITHIAAAWELNFGKESNPQIAVGVKHGNACGAAVSVKGKEIDVIEKMVIGDPLSIFGGVVITNFPIDEKRAHTLLGYEMGEGKRLLDTVVAPTFSEEARTGLARKAGKCRLFANPKLQNLSLSTLDREPRLRHVRGGFLKQPNYEFVLDFNHPELWKSRELTDSEKKDMLLAWAIGSTSNSNTITLVKDGALLGNAVGQQDRVGAATLAIQRARRAGHEVSGSVAYSDSFFPFPDGPQVLIDAGIKVIFASSGSVNDSKTKEVCEKANVALLLIPDGLCRGFFGH